MKEATECKHRYCFENPQMMREAVHPTELCEWTALWMQQGHTFYRSPLSITKQCKKGEWGNYRWVKYLDHESPGLCVLHKTSQLERVRFMLENKERTRKTSGKKRRGNKIHDRALREKYTWHYLMSVPGSFDKCVLIDVKSAFFSIYSRLEWDMHYLPGLFWGKGVLPWTDKELSFVAGDKIARNAVIGMSGGQQVRMIYRGCPVARVIPTTPMNAPMALFVLHYLQACMHDVVMHTNTYHVHTDGLICDESDAQTAMQIIDDWGLTPVVEEQGNAAIAHPGSYSIGKKSTKFFGLTRPKSHQTTVFTTEGGQDLFQWFCDVVRPRFLSLDERRGK